MCLIHRWDYQVIGKESVRICKKCYKKQTTKTGIGIYNFQIGDYVVQWKNTDLTNIERRELNLKKLIK